MRQNISDLPATVDRDLLHDLLTYLEDVLFPDIFLRDDQERLAFWNRVKDIGEKLMCRNPDSPQDNKIPVAEKLRKAACNKSHSEKLLVQYLRAKPGTLMHGLAPLASGVPQPKFLGFIVDCFSWLDVCNPWSGSCAEFLHTTPLWPETLREAQKLVKQAGYQVPFAPLDGIFRFISQHRYADAPADLSDAGGGANFLRDGWDFRFLSHKRITLSTRYDLLPLTVRDCAIEQIQSRLMKAALEKDWQFWLERLELIKRVANCHDQELFSNALRIIQLKHPTEKALLLGVAQEIDEDLRCLLAEQVLCPATWSDDEKTILTAFYLPLGNYPQEYTVLYWRRALLSAARKSLELNTQAGAGAACEKIIEYAKHCLAGKPDQEATETDLSFDEAVKCILRYWQRKWDNGSGKSDPPPEEIDKFNTQLACQILLRIDYEKLLTDQTSQDQLSNALAGLKRQKWAKHLLKKWDAQATSSAGPAPAQQEAA